MTSSQKKTILILTAITILSAVLFLLKLDPFAGYFGILFLAVMVFTFVLILAAFSMGNVSIKYILMLALIGVLNFGVFAMYYPSVKEKLVLIFFEEGE